jgi:thioredoxin 1
VLCLFLQSEVDAEEHLDYSSGNVTIIPDLRSWEQKLEEATELGQTVSFLDEQY